MIRDCTHSEFATDEVAVRDNVMARRANPPVLPGQGSDGVLSQVGDLPLESGCPVGHSAERWKSVSLARRFSFAGLGVFFVLVGYVGMFLPGIPTVGPLIFASYFFARSCPALERVLIRNRLFAKVLPYIDGNKEMPFSAKVTSILMMWLSISFSIWLLSYSEVGGLWLPSLILGSGLVGTFFILRYGKRKPKH